jgi:amino acid adenylation domain-containing protein
VSYLLHQLLERAAVERPDDVAFVDAEGACSYRDLDARANQVARVLAAEGVGPGDVVGLLLERSVATVVAIYGILKAGAGYVPLDPAAPGRRNAAAVGASGMTSLVVSSATAWQVSALVDDAPGLTHVLVVDDDDPAPMSNIEVTGRHQLGDQKTTPGRGDVIDDDAAYVLFTSGSTGTPKGVVISHRAALSFVRWASEEFGLRPTDRLCGQAPLHFDLSIFDLFSAVDAGASTALMPRADVVFPTRTVEFLRRHAITVWYSVPTLLMATMRGATFAAEALPDLRALLYAGEVFPRPQLRRLVQDLGTVPVFNLYGPTETNVITFERISAEELDALDPDAPGSIGWPVPNVRLALIGADGDTVARGDTGELCAAGATVMTGYLHRPDLDQRAFWSPPKGGLPGRYYRTGDLVSQRSDGRLDFIGRYDDQVKSRGFRIELREIENVMARHASVDQAVVLGVPDEWMGTRIVAFLVVERATDVASLRRHCARDLPSHMVPERIEIVPTLPYTSSGKVDRQALRLRAMKA